MTQTLVEDSKDQANGLGYCNHANCGHEYTDAQVLFSPAGHNFDSDDVCPACLGSDDRTYYWCQLDKSEFIHRPGECAE